MRLPSCIVWFTDLSCSLITTKQSLTVYFAKDGWTDTTVLITSLLSWVLVEYLISRQVLSTSQRQLWHCSLLANRPTALAASSHVTDKWLLLYTEHFWISIQVVTMLFVTWLVPHETASVSMHSPCTPCNHAPIYKLQWKFIWIEATQLSRAHVCLAVSVTCHMHFGMEQVPN